MKSHIKLLTVVVLAAFVLSACAPKTPQAQPTLKIAILPIVDALPLYVAAENGYFVDAGVQVVFIPAASAADRDQLIAANQADGMINDPVAVSLFNRDGSTIQVVRISRNAAPDFPMYRILVPAASAVQSAEDLAGVPIGISEYSVINYVTDQLLLQAGLKADQITTTAVAKIPDRLALLASGELGAATLPEPFGTLAIAQGARVILDDTANPGLGDSVLSFRTAVITDNPDAIRAFVSAVDRAVVEVNANPEAYRSLLTKYNLVPEAFAASYPIPTFPDPTVLTRAQLGAVNDWLVSKGKLPAPLDYTQSINDTFLP